jgi:hypothetical protein
MILDRNYDDLIEKYRANAEQIVKSEIELRLHPSSERLKSIADEWTIKDWWTAQECAILLMGVDPGSGNFFTDPDFPVYLVENRDRQKFVRILDLIHRRFGDRVNPAEACQWAASKGMKQEYLERALVGPGADAHTNFRPQQSKVRQEDTTKLDITRSQLLSAVAASRGFRIDKPNKAVGLFKKDLEKIGRGNMDDQTIRDCLIDANMHAGTKNKSFAEYYAEKRQSRKDGGNQ